MRNKKRKSERRESNKGGRVSIKRLMDEKQEEEYK